MSLHVDVCGASSTGTVRLRSMNIDEYFSRSSYTVCDRIMCAECHTRIHADKMPTQRCALATFSHLISNETPLDSFRSVVRSLVVCVARHYQTYMNAVIPCGLHSRIVYTAHRNTAHHIHIRHIPRTHAHSGT